MSETNKDTTKTNTQLSNEVLATQDSAKGTQVTVNLQGLQSEEVTLEQLLQTKAGEALANKIRSEETNKMHERLTKAKTHAETLEAEKKELLESQATLEETLKRTKEEKELASKSVEEQLAVLHKKQTEAEIHQKLIMENARKLIMEQELKTYKAEVVKEANLSEYSVIPDGLDSKAAIDEAVKQAKEREEAIAEKVKAELLAEKGNYVPGPLAPEQQNVAHTDHLANTPEGRTRLSNLSKEDYTTMRDKMMEAASKKTGWVRR